MKILLRSGKLVDVDTSEKACIEVSGFKPNQEVFDTYEKKKAVIIGVGYPKEGYPKVTFWGVEGDTNSEGEQIGTYVCNSFECGATKYLRG